MTIVRHPPFRQADLADHIADFLADLAQADRSPHTRRAYAADLKHFAAHHSGSLRAVTPDVLRGYFATLAGLSLATRARKQAAVASFLGWAMRQDRLDADPMAKVARVRPRTRHRAACRRRGSSGSWPRSPARRPATTSSSGSSTPPDCGSARRWGSTPRTSI